MVIVEGAVFGDEFGASHCNQCCLCCVAVRRAEVRKAIELAFVVVSGVDPGIDVLDGVYVPYGAGAVSGIFRHLRPPFV